MIDNLHTSEQNAGETSEIKETSWEQFENDCMTDEERIAFLEQLLRDEESLDQLASLEMAPMPAYLESEILESILGEEQLENSVVPVMAVLYIGTVIVLILLNLKSVPYFFSAVFTGRRNGCSYFLTVSRLLLPLRVLL